MNTTTPLLRPLSIGEILDGAFGLYRRNFVALLTTSVGLMLIPTLLTLVSQGFSVLVLVVQSVILPPLLIVQMSNAVHDRPVGLGVAWREGRGRILPYLGAAILMGSVIGLGILVLIIPGIYFSLRLYVTGPVAVLEPGVSALKRSGELTKGMLGKIFVVALVATLIVLLPTTALRLGTHLDALRPGHWMEVLKDEGITLVLNQLVAALIAPFGYAVHTLIYYDLRVRKDGYDVKVAANALAWQAPPGAQMPRY